MKKFLSVSGFGNQPGQVNSERFDGFLPFFFVLGSETSSGVGLATSQLLLTISFSSCCGAQLAYPRAIRFSFGPVPKAMSVMMSIEDETAILSSITTVSGLM